MSKSNWIYGGGAMATGIIKGILSGKYSDSRGDLCKRASAGAAGIFKRNYGLQLADSLKELAEKAKVLVLAVRPQGCRESSKRAF